MIHLAPYSFVITPLRKEGQLEKVIELYSTLLVRLDEESHKNPAVSLLKPFSLAQQEFQKYCMDGSGQDAQLNTALLYLVTLYESYYKSPSHAKKVDLLDKIRTYKQLLEKKNSQQFSSTLLPLLEDHLNIFEQFTSVEELSPLLLLKGMSLWLMALLEQADNKFSQVKKHLHDLETTKEQLRKYILNYEDNDAQREYFAKQISALKKADLQKELTKEEKKLLGKFFSRKKERPVKRLLIDYELCSQHEALEKVLTSIEQYIGQLLNKLKSLENTSSLGRENQESTKNLMIRFEGQLKNILKQARVADAKVIYCDSNIITFTKEIRLALATYVKTVQNIVFFIDVIKTYAINEVKKASAQLSSDTKKRFDTTTNALSQLSYKYSILYDSVCDFLLELDS